MEVYIIVETSTMEKLFIKNVYLNKEYAEKICERANKMSEKKRGTWRNKYEILTYKVKTK